MISVTRYMHTSRTSRYFADAPAKCKCAQGLGLPPTFADLGEAYTPLEKWAEVFIAHEVVVLVPRG
jgi:hypothetical protein